MPTIRRTPRFAALVVASACAFGLSLNGQIPVADAELQYQLANLLTEETRYSEALDAFEKAAGTTDPALALRARKGHVKTALRLAEFDLALEGGQRLATDAPTDPEALSLHGDALWSGGLFDEAESMYEKAVGLGPESSRAQYGIARSLATRNKLDEALERALKAIALAPRDGEIYASIAEIYERLHRFDEAAGAYTNYINLLPNKDRSDKAAWSRAQVRFLEAFSGLVPVQVDPALRQRLHTVDFKLVDDKVVVKARVNDGRWQDFILDTGSEQTTISRQTASSANV